jgi:hypothetical protein
MHRATNQIGLTWSTKDKFLKTRENLQTSGAGRALSVPIHTVYNYAIAQRRGGGLPIQSRWPEGALRQHADSRYKLVPGHHAVDPINGFSACSRVRSAQSAPAKISALVSDQH